MDAHVGLAIGFTCSDILHVPLSTPVATILNGVRGGTINAISSSLPELFKTLIGLLLLSDRDEFAVGIGTNAGRRIGCFVAAVTVMLRQPQSRWPMNPGGLLVRMFGAHIGGGVTWE